jgi:hypothetical protein
MDSNSAVLRASRSGLVTVSVAVAEEGEVLVQSCPLRHSGRLFAEHLLRSCDLQVALLRCQAGRLVPGARPTYRSAASVWWSCPWVASGSTSKLMLTILAGVATWEREIMLERQREGIAKAKAAGKYKGRPVSIDAAQIQQLRATLGPAAIAKRLGIARSSVYRALA